MELATRSWNCVLCLCTFQVNRKETFRKYFWFSLHFDQLHSKCSFYGFIFFKNNFYFFQATENGKFLRLIKCKYFKYLQASWMKFFYHPEQLNSVYYAWNCKHRKYVDDDKICRKFMSPSHHVNECVSHLVILGWNIQSYFIHWDFPSALGNDKRCLFPELQVDEK